MPNKKDKSEEPGDFAELEGLDELADMPEAPVVGKKETSIKEEPFGAEALSQDVPVKLVAVLGKKTISLNELLQIKQGQVIDLDRPPSEIVDLVANGQLVGRGELVDMDGKLGVRILKMLR